MIVHGKEIAENIINKLKTKFHYEKRVCFVQFGNDAASTAFIKRKRKIADELKIKTEVLHEPTPLSMDWAIRTMKEVIAKKYDGIVIQLPLPRILDVYALINIVPPAQDIDVLGDIMIQRFKGGVTKRLPPVAFAVAQIIKQYDVTLTGKNIVVLGKGKLVGEPVIDWFKTQGVEPKAFEYSSDKIERDIALKNADIVVTGIGSSHFVKPEMLKKGVVLIDAGTSEQAGKLAGDCDPSCADVAKVFSTVPGGVGPITVAGLFSNLAVE